MNKLHAFTEAKKREILGEPAAPKGQDLGALVS